MRHPVTIANPPAPERALLVGHASRAGAALERSIEELALLADTAGARVVDRLVQRRGTIHPATFIGKGKLEELRLLAQERDAAIAIFDDDLSPAQVRNLEKALSVKVVDRSELILDIFARRARTRESRLQVELAQLEYSLPRLTGMWKHLERQAGGIGTRGPGETQLETDRRLVGERIARLKRELAAVERERETQRRKRRGEFRAALVGYTNAGKSTLFNTLTRSNVFVENRLFATLDATTRQMVSPERTVALVTDTVGFIRKLPHHLVASFRSTLTEATEANLLVHVVDAADPDFRRQMSAVDTVLEEILTEPRPTLLVFNKADRLADPALAPGLRAEFPDCRVVSARTGEGLAELRADVWGLAAARRGKARVVNPAQQTQLAFRTELLAPPARVFAAITRAEHLGHWFCDEAESDPRAGGRIVFRWRRPGASAEPYLGEWTAFEPHSRCAFTGGHPGYPGGHGGHVELSLEPAGTGTVMSITHAMPARPEYGAIAETYAEAWPRALARLAGYLTPREGPGAPG